MISNLLTAAGVAVLSMQTPTARPTAEPMRANYNSSAVADYGTTGGKIYNYTSSTLEIGKYIEEDNTLNEAQAHAFQLEPSSNTGFTLTGGVRFENSNSTAVSGQFSISPYDANQKVDLYKNGELFAVLEYQIAHGPNGYYFSIQNEETAQNDYLWLFDHEDPAPMSQTIIETAGDATTAAATVIGAGFTGVISLFYNEGLTGLGILALIVAGVSLVWFALALILRLWKGRA